MIKIDERFPLLRRFLGVDFSFRRDGVDWPKPWRASLVTSKNERNDYRIVVYGDSFAEAESALNEAVRTIDDSNKTTL